MKNNKTTKQALLESYVRMKTKKALKESADGAALNVDALHEDIMQELEAFQAEPTHNPQPQAQQGNSRKEAGRKWLEAAKRERQGGQQQLPEGDAVGAMELPLELHEQEPASAFDEDAYVLEPGANPELEEGMYDARNAAGREQWKNLPQTDPSRYAQHTGKAVGGDVRMPDGSVRRTTFIPNHTEQSRQNTARALNHAHDAIEQHRQGWTGRDEKVHAPGTPIDALKAKQQERGNWSSSHNNADRSREYLASASNLASQARQHLPEGEEVSQEMEEGIMDGLKNMFGKDSTIGRGAQALSQQVQQGAQAVQQGVSQAANQVSQVAGQVKNDFQQGNTAGAVQSLHKELDKITQSFKQEGEALKQEMSELNRARAEFMNRRREALEAVHQRFDTLYQKMAGLMKIDPNQQDYKSFIDQRMGVKNPQWQAAPDQQTSNRRLA